MRVRSGLLMLVVVLFVAGCSGGGDDDDRADNGAKRATTTSAGKSADAGAKPVAPLRILTLNVLHGLFCEKSTDSCQAADRAEMVATAIEAADCPELVGFQEIGPRQPEVVPPAMEAVCAGRYELAWAAKDSPDREMVFTTLPITDRGYLDLAAFPWEAYWVRVKAPAGAVDFLTTHLASSANNPPCTSSSCPPACAPGITTNECNGIEIVQALDARRDGAVLQITGGDFNARVDSPTVAAFTKAGFVDSWLLAGEAECDPATGVSCTSGRERPENALDGLDVPDGHFSSRIDFVMARPAAGCTLKAAAEPFAAAPLAQPFKGLYWPSDHAGVLAELTCA